MKKKYQKGNTWVAILVIVVIVILIGAFAGNRTDTHDGETGDMVMQSTEELTNGVYMIDRNESTVGYVGRKALVESEHVGTFPVLEGTVTVEDGVVAEGVFVLDVAGLTDDGSGVGEHLRGEDFFDVLNFPRATFVLTHVADNMAEGDLELKEIIHAVEFPVAIVDEGDALHATAEFAIDRTKWDIIFGSGSFFDDLGDKAIDDMVTITLDLHAHLEGGEDMMDEEMEIEDTESSERY